MLNELTSISPIDGRYRKQTEDLSEFFSEYGYIKHRVYIEIKWLTALLNEDFIDANVSDEQLSQIENIYENFDVNECSRVKQIEQTTNHDVKAIEYYVREKLAEIDLQNIVYLVHFGCTSEDINNLAYGLMIKRAMNEVVCPNMIDLRDSVRVKAKEWSNISMLAHTHGQPATPTTVGKELAVFVNRLDNQIANINYFVEKITGKFSGAVGTYGAWNMVYPNVDWIEFNKQFVENLGLSFNVYSTQIENHDMICMLFSAIKSFNNVLQDFNSDMWLYISMNYFKQKVVSTETGSSVMPHKVNPINHENSMANIRIANSLFDSFTNNLQISRMQRDLTDSSMQRDIGVALSHTLIATKQSIKAFEKMEPNCEVLEQDLENHPEVIAEAIQTVLRKNRYDNAYELLKDFTRGKNVTLQDLRDFINGLEIDANDKTYLMELMPQTYIGLAEKLCDML